MFPNLTYHLYDKRAHLVKENDNIKIFNEYFTDRHAEKYKNKNVLMISDIRTLDIKHHKDQSIKKNKKAIDEIIENDLHMQIRWYEIINPLSALIKFRLPWYKPFTDTIDGDVYFQAWAHNYSSETRIVPKKGSRKKWDNKLFESIIYYHNKVTRQEKIKGDEKYSHCIGNYYDSIVEARVLDEYIKKFNYKGTLCDLSISISMFLSRHLKKNKLNEKYIMNVL